MDPSCGGDTTPCEGTFTSFFDVFFDLSFTTLSGTPLPCDTTGDTVCRQPDLTPSGVASWTDGAGLFVVGGQVTETHPGAGVQRRTAARYAGTRNLWSCSGRAWVWLLFGGGAGPGADNIAGQRGARPRPFLVE